MALKDWSLTAADNDTVPDATYGNISWPENQNPNTVNDSARAEMAHVRAFYETLEWRDLGHTVTRTGNTTFTIASADDLSDYYTVGRRIRCEDSSTLHGKISATSHNGVDTHTVTVSLDSGNLSASLASVSLGFDVTNKPVGVACLEVGTSGRTLRSNGTDAVWEASVRGFCAYKTADVAISSGSFTSTNVTFGTELYDTESSHVAATGVVTIPSWATKVRWTLSIEFDANSTGRRSAAVTQLTGTTTSPFPYWQTAAISGGTTIVGGTTGWLSVTAGDTYQPQVYQDSGGSLNLLGSNSRTYFAAEFSN